jgi:hypothetical protein
MFVKSNLNLPQPQEHSNSQGMGTDDFLRTFGNGGKDKSMMSNAMNPEMVRNFIRT